MDYLARLSQGLVKIHFFVSKGGPSSVVKLGFEDNGVVQGTPIVDRWELISVDQLKLYKNTELLAILRLMPEGVWQGRVRATDDMWELRAFTSEGEECWKDIVRGKVVNFEYEEKLPVQLDWKAASFDIREVAEVKGDRAIAIVGNDRPLYLQRVVHTVAQNKEVYEDKYPVYIFLDKSLDGDESVTDQQEEATLKVIPHATIIRRPVNFGCGRQLIDVRRQLFDHAKYERGYIFEDDMLVSRNYITLCNNLADWCHARYDNVGVVQGWNWCTLGRVERRQRLSAICANASNFWGYMMFKWAWDKIKSYMYEYEDLFLGGIYSSRPHRSILTWFKGMGLDGIAMPVQPFPEDPAYLNKVRRYIATPPTGQDAVTFIALNRMQICRVGPYVNRGLYIGKEGIHMSPQRWVQHGYASIMFEDYLADKIRHNFDIISPELEIVLDEDEDFRYVNMIGGEMND